MTDSATFPPPRRETADARHHDRHGLLQLQRAGSPADGEVARGDAERGEKRNPFRFKLRQRRGPLNNREKTLAEKTCIYRFGKPLTFVRGKSIILPKLGKAEV